MRFSGFSAGSAIALFLLVFLLPLWCCTGCGSKTPPSQGAKPHLSEQAKKSAKAGQSGNQGKSPGKKTGTQKPYVINGITYYPIPSAKGYRESGIASWYGKPFHGRRTSNGEIYDMYGDTAAHKTLPMNTMLLVRNLENGRITTVRINDRGPFVRERIIDLSYTKARDLGILARGTARVEIVALEAASGAPAVAARPSRQAPASRPTTGKSPATKTPGLVSTPPPQPTPNFDQGNFFVQVGAFERVADARVLAKKFAKRGRDVVIQQYPAAGMNLYRVLVFASHSLREARAYEARMRASGFKYTLLLAR